MTSVLNSDARDQMIATYFPGELVVSHLQWSRDSSVWQSSGLFLDSKLMRNKLERWRYSISDGLLLEEVNTQCRRGSIGHNCNRIASLIHVFVCARRTISLMKEIIRVNWWIDENRHSCSRTSLSSLFLLECSIVNQIWSGTASIAKDLDVCMPGWSLFTSSTGNWVDLFYSHASIEGDATTVSDDH